MNTFHVNCQRSFVQPKCIITFFFCMAVYVHCSCTCYVYLGGVHCFMQIIYYSTGELMSNQLFLEMVPLLLSLGCVATCVCLHANKQQTNPLICLMSLLCTFLRTQGHTCTHVTILYQPAVQRDQIRREILQPGRVAKLQTHLTQLHTHVKCTCNYCEYIH